MDLEEYIDTLSPNVKPEGFAKSLMYELIKDEISEVVRGRDGLSLPDYVFLANAPELLSVDDAIDVFEQSNQTIFPPIYSESSRCFEWFIPSNKGCCYISAR